MTMHNIPPRDDGPDDKGTLFLVAGGVAIFVVLIALLTGMSIGFAWLTDTLKAAGCRHV